MTTPEQWQKLPRLADKAEPTPWVLGGISGRMITTPTGYVGDGFLADVDTKENAEYIIVSANLAPGLARDVERLTESNATKQKLLDEADVLIGQQLALSETLVRYEKAIESAISDLSLVGNYDTAEDINDIIGILRAALAAGERI